MGTTEAGGRGQTHSVSIVLPNVPDALLSQGMTGHKFTLLPAVLPQDGMVENSMKGTWTLSPALPLVEAGLLCLEKLRVTLQVCSYVAFTFPEI